MSAKIVTVGGYVRLDLRYIGDFGSLVIGGQIRTEKELLDDLKKLATAAKTRLNEFQDEFGGARVVLERESVCEHCGAVWTEKSHEYNGGCCEADEQNAPKEVA